MRQKKVKFIRHKGGILHPGRRYGGMDGHQKVLDGLRPPIFINGVKSNSITLQKKEGNK